jgi:molecular chaperone GrpE
MAEERTNEVEGADDPSIGAAQADGGGVAGGAGAAGGGAGGGGGGGGGGSDPDDEGATPAAANAPPEAAALLVDLEKARAKLRDTHDRLLRTAADFENFKKRAAREREQYVARAGENVLRDILPALDNMDRAMRHKDAAADPSALVEGLAMIHKQFIDALARHGVTPFDAVGQKFDPALHEAIQQATSPDHAPGTVVSEFARGYMMGGKLLRPALVVVAAPGSGGATGAADGGGGGGGAGNGQGAGGNG